MEQVQQTETINVRTHVIKRNGQEVGFDISKIINAISKANQEVSGIHMLSMSKIYKIW